MALAAEPSADRQKPADDPVDFLLRQSTTAPSSRPVSAATMPASPFGERTNQEVRRGVVVLSNGQRIVGEVWTTREKPLRIWDDREKEYKDIPFLLVKTIEASILWEREEKEWRFKESGSDVKVYSGKTYPARELKYTIEMENGQKVIGGVVAPVYVATGEKDFKYTLNKRQKGDVGEKLLDLIYIVRIEFEKK